MIENQNGYKTYLGTDINHDYFKIFPSDKKFELTEDEIDREQELITIKKKDGTIVKEISYGSVTINISKTPAIEKSGAVLLRVDSVEGLATITNEGEPL